MCVCVWGGGGGGGVCVCVDGRGGGGGFDITFLSLLWGAVAYYVSWFSQNRENSDLSQNSHGPLSQSCLAIRIV